MYAGSGVSVIFPQNLSTYFYSRLMQELHFAEWEFSIYFVGYCDPAEIPSDPKERTRWCFQQVRVFPFWFDKISATQTLELVRCDHGSTALRPVKPPREDPKCNCS